MQSRAVIYARQSQDRSGERAAVDRQVADCEAKCAERGWTVVDKVVDNDMSAYSGKRRPGYLQVLEMLRSGVVTHVVVWHIDRLARNTKELEVVVDICEGTGGVVSAVTGDIDLSNDVGRLVARILGAVARAEVERKSARQLRANRQRAEAGEAFFSTRPVGYERVDGEVLVVAAEAEALRYAAARVLAGATLAGVCRELDARDSTSIYGAPWRVTSLRRALLNPRYSGRVVYKGEFIREGIWPAILDADTQQRVKEVLSDPVRRMQQGVELKHLLSGILRCGVCDGRLYSGAGKTAKVYRCRSMHLQRSLAEVDLVVTEAVLARLRRPDAAKLLNPDVDLAALRSEADEMCRRRDALAQMLTAGIMTAEAVRGAAEELTCRIQAAESQIGSALTRTPVTNLAEAPDVRAAWHALTVRVQRDVVDLLCELTLLPVGKGARFSPDQVRIQWRGGSDE